MIDPTRVRVFPVRHHSPTAARLLDGLIRQMKPEVIAIEGPSDADSLIDLLLDEETSPPVAILAYTQEDDPKSVFYPFAEYSPEYVAMKVGREMGAKLTFVDIPASVVLVEKDDRSTFESHYDLLNELAYRLGHRSFEEFWESAFESADHPVADFESILTAYASLLREMDRSSAGGSTRDRAREAWMLRRIDELGVPAEKVLFVTGAYHAAGFAQGDVDVAAAEALAKPVECALTLIPYSYPRLSERLGYGAGNRAPQYYARVWERGGDFDRASLETLVLFTDHLHAKGYSASLADAIEGYRLARMLAKMRQKQAPGLDEVRDAAVACLLQGDAGPIDTFLWDMVIGRGVGRVTSKIGKNSLQVEFYRELNKRRIPLMDEPREFILHLTHATDISTSIFLHRLRVMGIPFGQIMGTAAGSYEFLAQVREKWEVQWSPSVDAALVEKIVLGNSFAEVCERMLAGKLQVAKTARDATEILLEIAVAGVQSLYPRALAICDEASSRDADFASLAQSCQKLQTLVSYGSSRQVAREELMQLLERSYNRALLVLPAGSATADEGAPAVCNGMKLLHEIAMNAGSLDGELFFRVIGDLTTSYRAHPSVAGLALALLNMSQRLPQEELVMLLHQRLSAGNPAVQAGQFLAGFLSINRLLVVKNRTLVRALDEFIQSVVKDDFVNALPVLRRAFADLTKGEVGYLIENLSTLHKIEEAKQAKAIVEDRGVDVLKEADEDMKKLLGDWEDLFK